MASRLVELADAVVATLTTAIGTPTAPLTVTTSRVYVPSVDPESLTANARRVDVYPIGRVDAGPVSRSTDAVQNKIGVVVYERYAEAGSPSNAWIDDRMEWVETYIEANLKDPRIRESGAYVETYEVESYSPEQLATNKLFWCEVIVTLMDEQ